MIPGYGRQVRKSAVHELSHRGLSYANVMQGSSIFQCDSNGVFWTTCLGQQATSELVDVSSKRNPLDQQPGTPSSSRLIQYPGLPHETLTIGICVFRALRAYLTLFRSKCGNFSGLKVIPHVERVGHAPTSKGQNTREESVRLQMIASERLVVKSIWQLQMPPRRG